MQSPDVEKDILGGVCQYTGGSIKMSGSYVEFPGIFLEWREVPRPQSPSVYCGVTEIPTVELWDTLSCLTRYLSHEILPLAVSSVAVSSIIMLGTRLRKWTERRPFYAHNSCNA
ncbi:hypothetical protein GCM10010924_49130 [Rhizobium wenxiniae]|nr:hypothetical protein GCM10010924_49130 [Rhizobium wenxiniae]